MIPRSDYAQPPPLKDPDPASEPVATKTIEVRDVDINFGRDDTISFTLGPDDTMLDGPSQIVIHLKGEVIEIDRPRVRWRSTRQRALIVAISLDPADADGSH